MASAGVDAMYNDVNDRCEDRDGVANKHRQTERLTVVLRTAATVDHDPERPFLTRSPALIPRRPRRRAASRSLGSAADLGPHEAKGLAGHGHVEDLGAVCRAPLSQQLVVSQLRQVSLERHLGAR